jgi:ABC-type lipoprotein release transport system permease subunit
MEDMAVRFNLPDRMYPSLSFISIMLGPGVVFLFSLLASLYPAVRLFFLQPVTAMRAV